MSIRYFNHNPVIKGDILTYGEENEIFCLINEDNILENTYYLSNYGRIFNINNNHEFFRQIKEDGTNYVMLYTKDRKSKKNIHIHRLVAKYFVLQTKEDKNNKRNIVKFKDGNKNNIYSWNLEWSNLSSVRTKKSNTKIDIRLVNYICSLLELEYSINNIVEALSEIGITYNIVYNIAIKRTWVEVSCNYNINYKVKTRLKEVI